MQTKETNTRNRKKVNLRVREKKSGHAKRGKQEIACRGKEGQTRKKEKMRNYVSGKRGGGHAKKRR